MDKKTFSRLLIASVTPYFLERDGFWFKKNLSKIIELAKTQTFWQENILYLEKDKKIKLSFLLRRLEDMGYERVFRINGMGEFSQMGGIVDIFPVNLDSIVKIEFAGDKIDNIYALEKRDEIKEKELLKKRLRTQKAFSEISNLKPGEFVVHLDHGIGKFINYEILYDSEESKKNKLRYFVIEYAHNARLYVPETLQRKLTRYIAFGQPKLSSLGATLNWVKKKRKAQQEAERFAQKILQTLAQKESSTRQPLRYSLFERALEESCPFELTPDQQKALEDIHRDFNKPSPMDRILVGDVGFGKTEIALRAAARSAENGRQVLLIVPTTTLAIQHFETFENRLKNTPLNVSLLTRLQPPSKVRQILSDLKSGLIDILIATHRGLTKNIEFKNLGLLIIDDEQKFGVKHKEYWREKKPNIDVLSISATPIPRTLYMGLIGLRQISFIKTPPVFKKEIKTFVAPFSKKIISRAIQQEIDRKGQAYFLHNRVKTIESAKKFLNDINPKWQIITLHGQLKSSTIKERLEKFKRGQADILLATTIIENGLHLENVNTIIVEDATKLGLSQAHQIRGRIGRGFRQGFVYFLYRKGRLTQKSKMRLMILKNLSKPGEGYKIAEKDLQMRGAGNILGREQWGTINKVGLNLYCQMLSETIERLKISPISKKTSS